MELLFSNAAFIYISFFHMHLYVFIYIFISLFDIGYNGIP